MNNNNGYVQHKIENHAASIEFFHPKGNSLPGYLLDELTKTFRELSANDLINVIVLTSKGEGTFCGGASFDELIKIDNEIEGKKFFMGFANVINSMRKCPKFIVCRVHGKVVGGGVGLVSACDYVLASESASVKLSELALGIGPFVIEPVVTRRIGKASFAALTVNYDWRSAQWALDKGLYDELLPSIGELDSSLTTLTARLSKSNPDAVKELKKIFWEEENNWDDVLERRAEISGKLVLSDHTKKFIADFKNK